ncbi:hypothetical protein Sjap_020569 [Stephania japonica]|uniref:Uncharacterized protein n=1 Tax=Stephania japonica TaxID=461633 RepID=A0AAP0F0X6_9MAGN
MWSRGHVLYRNNNINYNFSLGLALATRGQGINSTIPSDTSVPTILNSQSNASS